jgi:hypothetical protein
MAKGKAEAFKHTPRELLVLRRAHATYMEHLRAGHKYDVVKRAWVDRNGESLPFPATSL